MKKSATIALLCTSLYAFPQSYTARQYLDDFNSFCNTIDSNYCYFNKKPVDWPKIRTLYRPAIDTVTAFAGFITVLEKVMGELYDHHASLRVNTSASPGLVPTDADIWAEFLAGRPTVVEVRRQMNADLAGIRAGMEVVAIDGKPVDSAIAPFVAHTNDAEARNCALRLALNGNMRKPRTITMRSGDSTRVFFPDSNRMATRKKGYTLLVESRTDGGIGYIRINNCLYDNSVITLFDSTLDAMMSTKAMILDLRETPSGGNTSVARAILGRFIKKEQFYQKHEYYAEEKETGIRRSWVEIVSPRGRTYEKPLVILADHWTGSVSEGITIGFDGMHRATVIGTTLARLNGAVETFTLPNTGIKFNIPTERLYNVDGQPRENFRPQIEVSATGRTMHSQSDQILDAAMSYLKQKLKK